LGLSETVVILLVAVVAIAFSALMIFGVVLIVRPLFGRQNDVSQA
jgi:hypothetical protein